MVMGTLKLVEDGDTLLVLDYYYEVDLFLLLYSRIRFNRVRSNNNPFYSIYQACLNQLSCQ